MEILKDICMAMFRTNEFSKLLNYAWLDAKQSHSNKTKFLQINEAKNWILNKSND